MQNFQWIHALLNGVFLLYLRLAMKKWKNIFRITCQRLVGSDLMLVICSKFVSSLSTVARWGESCSVQKGRLYTTVAWIRQSHDMSERLWSKFAMRLLFRRLSLPVGRRAKDAKSKLLSVFSKTGKSCRSNRRDKKTWPKDVQAPVNKTFAMKPEGIKAKGRFFQKPFQWLTNIKTGTLLLHQLTPQNVIMYFYCVPGFYY